MAEVSERERLHRRCLLETLLEANEEGRLDDWGYLVERKLLRPPYDEPATVFDGCDYGYSLALRYELSCTVRPKPEEVEGVEGEPGVRILGLGGATCAEEVKNG